MLTGGAASAVRSVVTGAGEACQGSSQAQCGPNGLLGTPETRAAAENPSIDGSRAGYRESPSAG
jgi:hypothetical protein